MIFERLITGTGEDPVSLAADVLLNKLPQLIDDGDGVEIALALFITPGKQTVPAKNNPIARGILLHRLAQHHAQLKARALPGQPDQLACEAGIKFGQLFMTVGGGGQRDSPIRMKVVNMRKGQKSVQWRIDRGGHAVLAEGAERIHLHHLVFMRHAAVAAGQREQLVEIERSEAAALDAAQVPPASLHPQDHLPARVQRIYFSDLRAGIATAEVGDAQIGSEQIGTVAQQLLLIKSLRHLIVPAIFQITERSHCTCTHVRSSIFNRTTNSIQNSTAGPYGMTRFREVAEACSLCRMTNP